MSQDFLEYSIAILLKRQRFIINSFQSCSIPMFNLTFDGMFFNPYILWGGGVILSTLVLLVKTIKK